MVNLHADLLHALLRRDDALDLRALAAPYRTPLVEAVWSWRDPAPVRGAVGHAAPRGERLSPAGQPRRDRAELDGAVLASRGAARSTSITGSGASSRASSSQRSLGAREGRVVERRQVQDEAPRLRLHELVFAGRRRRP